MAQPSEPASGRLCYRCGDQLAEDASFCVACGAVCVDLDEKRGAAEAELVRRKAKLENAKGWLSLGRRFWLIRW